MRVASTSCGRASDQLVPRGRCGLGVRGSTTRSRSMSATCSKTFDPTGRRPLRRQDRPGIVVDLRHTISGGRAGGRGSGPSGGAFDGASLCGVPVRHERDRRPTGYTRVQPVRAHSEPMQDAEPDLAQCSRLSHGPYGALICRACIIPWISASSSYAGSASDLHLVAGRRRAGSRTPRSGRWDRGFAEPDAPCPAAALRR